jgi:tetratricopeptide (TPR) repeat protein/beta-lactamase regulating signal transducer with metallopeptidase domain
MFITDLFFIGNTFWMGIANHLWQSTMFAVAAWIITLFLKKNRARIRYWLWFSVSIKFLIPFSLFISLGSFIAPEWMKTQVEVAPQLNIIQTINQPFNMPEMEEVYASVENAEVTSPANKLPIIIFSLWMCGSLALIINWHKRVMKVSKMARKAEPLNDKHRFDIFHRIKQKNRMSETIQIASTRDMMEPGVFGIFRPVLFLPEGISKHINDAELEAILIHEFEHIRCKDNLVAFIHMIVQALFWFHPIIWLTGAKLVLERELACDESVLRSVKNPQAYAEGILKVCEIYLESPVVCVSGVIGSNLKKRVEGIMKKQIGHKLSLVKRLVLSMAGLLALGIPLALGVINAPNSQARIFNPDTDKYTVDEYKPDSFQVLDKPDNSNMSSEILNKEQANHNLSIALNEGAKSKPESSQVLKKESPPIILASTGIQTAKDTGKKRENLSVARENVSSPNNENRIKLAKMEPPVEATSDSGKNEAVVKTEDANKYISSGFSYLKTGKTEEAVISFDKAIALDSRKSIVYVARGSAYFRLGRFDKALSDFSKAIEIDPGLAAAYQNRGSVYYRQGQFDKAMSDYNRAIEIEPGFAVTYIDRGNIYMSQDRFDDAISDFSRAIEINPRIAAAYDNRGNAYYHKGKFSSALSDYRKALKLNPDDAVIHTSRGMAYLSQNYYPKALNEFNKAIKLNPGYANAYINRGTCYNYIGEYNKAAADYKKALELDPGNTLSQKMIKYCESDVKRIEALNKFKYLNIPNTNIPGNVAETAIAAAALAAARNK